MEVALHTKGAANTRTHCSLWLVYSQVVGSYVGPGEIRPVSSVDRHPGYHPAARARPRPRRGLAGLEQAGDIPIGVDVDIAPTRLAAQAGHGAHLATEGIDESRPRT